MASCVRNILAKNYQNLIIGFQVMVENVGDVFWDTVYTVASAAREVRCFYTCKCCFGTCLEKQPAEEKRKSLKWLRALACSRYRVIWKRTKKEREIIERKRRREIVSDHGFLVARGVETYCILGIKVFVCLWLFRLRHQCYNWRPAHGSNRLLTKVSWILRC